jgi:gamma-glutamylaminecyclotransferase
MPLLFVYGTLKDGFCNAPRNSGVRVPGVFETVERHGLYVVGNTTLPWLIERDTAGLQVQGELFEVAAADLVALDAFEQVDEAGWYTRKLIAVRQFGAVNAASLQAHVYFGCSLAQRPQAIHCGPLLSYTCALDQQFGHAA